MRFPTINRRLASTALALLLAATSVRAERREFSFVADASVDEHGLVTAADVLDESIAPEFESTLVALIKRWRFNPARAEGKAVGSTTTFYFKVVAEIENGKATVTATYGNHGPRIVQKSQQQHPPVFPRLLPGTVVDAVAVYKLNYDASGDVIAVELHSLSATTESRRIAEKFSRSGANSVSKWKFKTQSSAGKSLAGSVLQPIRFTSRFEPVAEWTWHVLPPPSEDKAIANSAEFSELPMALDNATGLEFISDGSRG